ncbi:MAG: hypothetical protein F6K23_08955 [Okeania sp. SIO2C9]|uniref:hypothetical protein n=1 Tax=Okeania sp. SIO2C9 TaxID=2607791 RepID=UPI0013C1942E|nr:hypothetical protein [Okeania sp. SIO2C9]NEQ73192.1 hypothetical protein [Okeania sp. SIO2C9]
MGRWGVWEKLKNIYPHHYHAGLPNFERTLENATAKINLCLIRLMLKRLAIA